MSEHMSYRGVWIRYLAQQQAPSLDPVFRASLDSRLATLESRLADVERLLARHESRLRALEALT